MVRGPRATGNGLRTKDHCPPCVARGPWTVELRLQTVCRVLWFMSLGLCVIICDLDSGPELWWKLYQLGIVEFP